MVSASLLKMLLCTINSQHFFFDIPRRLVYLRINKIPQNMCMRYEKILNVYYMSFKELQKKAAKNVKYVVTKLFSPFFISNCHRMCILGISFINTVYICLHIHTRTHECGKNFISIYFIFCFVSTWNWVIACYF